jgi:hypothetical protein
MQLVSICQVYRFKLGHDVDSFEGAWPFIILAFVVKLTNEVGSDLKPY